MIDIMMNAHVCPELKEPDRLLLQAAKLTETLDAVVSDSCEEQRVSGEIAWQLIQGLIDARLERLRDESSSERGPSIVVLWYINQDNLIKATFID